MQVGFQGLSLAFVTVVTALLEKAKNKREKKTKNVLQDIMKTTHGDRGDLDRDGSHSKETEWESEGWDSLLDALFEVDEEE